MVLYPSLVQDGGLLLRSHNCRADIIDGNAALSASCDTFSTGLLATSRPSFDRGSLPRGRAFEECQARQAYVKVVWQELEFQL